MTSYKVAITRQVTNALKKTFSGSYSTLLMQNMKVGPDFQMVKESFPQIYIVYNERTLKNLGLGHYVTQDTSAGAHRVFEWMYQGSLTFNCFALSSLDRDTMADNLLDVIAFGQGQSGNSALFHQEILDNDFISMVFMKDQAYPGGDNTLPAPWGASNEQLYHVNYSFDITGEFFADPSTSGIIQLSQVNHFPYRPGQSIPSGSNDPSVWA